LFAVVFVGVCWLGIVLLSPRLVPLVHHQPGLNEILGEYLQYFGVIFGLLAVATYQNHTDVEKAVANEASSLAALYRDISAYPEPDRTDLKNAIREYTRSTIEQAWPLQRQGIDPWKVNRAAPLQRGWPHSSQRQNRRKHSTTPRCVSSMISSRIDGTEFSVSPLAYRLSCGTRSRLAH